MHGEVAATACLQVIPTWILPSPTGWFLTSVLPIPCLLATMELSSSRNPLAKAEGGSILDGILAKGFLRFRGAFFPPLMLLHYLSSARWLLLAEKW